MPVSNAIAQARSEYFSREVPTRVDIRPDAAPEAANPSASKDFFGGDGLTFRDVLDAINPLNHIPIVSDVFASATEHKASTASRLVGGTLLGGPIGFIASLASVVFEDATGTSPAQAVYAAVTGGASTQVASAQATKQTASNTNMPEDIGQLASLAPSAPTPSVSEEESPAPAGPMTAKDKAVLELYGSSADSAHASYRKAQLLPYLREVNTSKVL